MTDNRTGLMWQKEDDGSTHNWYEASGTYNGAFNEVTLDVCGDLVLGGHSDWKLPGKKELTGIVNYGISSPGPTIEPAYFPNTESENYWSATLYAAAVTDAVVVGFRYGNNGNLSLSSVAYVRCVRGNPAAGNLVDNGNTIPIIPELNYP